MQLHHIVNFTGMVDFEHLIQVISGVDLDVLSNIVQKAQEGIQVNNPAWSS